MNVRIESSRVATVMVVEGRLDFGAAAAFQKEVERVLAAAAAAPAHVIIDCAGLDYVSSAGLRVFLLAAKLSQRGSMAFALCALQPAVREVMDLSGFSRIIAVHDDRTTALARAGGRPP
jgi:anti-anti-sigma factor